MTTIHLITLVCVVLLVAAAWLVWPRFSHRFGFGDSETIFLSRLQVLVGVLMATDLAPILPAGWLPYYVVAVGLIGEIARRNRADDL